MSKLNLHRNIFLEKEEILRFQKFMLESPVNKTFLSNTLTWGVIDTSGGSSPNDFKVEVGSTSGTVKIANLSRALDSDGLLIEQSAIDNISIPSGGSYYWLKIGHVYRNLEEGTISINTQGVVTGLGTKFTEVLRGQSTEVPVKIKLISSNNIAVYEIVDVTDDLNCILQGETFVAENGISYYVIGSTPLGVTVTTEQQEGLYYYDSCVITQVAETVSETEPAGLVSDKEFWIARVVNNSGAVTIEDKRDNYYWEYYIRGVSNKLSNNPADWSFDIEQQTIAQDALNVYSKEDVESLTGTDIVDWVLLDRGTVAQSTEYDIRMKRIGRVCVCQGKFKGASSGISVGNSVASVATASIGGTISVPIYFATQGYISGTDNKGLKLHMEVSGGNYQIVVDELSSPGDITYRFNFSFFLDTLA